MRRTVVDEGRDLLCGVARLLEDWECRWLVDALRVGEGGLAVSSRHSPPHCIPFVARQWPETHVGKVESQECARVVYPSSHVTLTPASGSSSKHLILAKQ